MGTQRDGAAVVVMMMVNNNCYSVQNQGLVQISMNLIAMGKGRRVEAQRC